MPGVVEMQNIDAATLLFALSLTPLMIYNLYIIYLCSGRDFCKYIVGDYLPRTTPKFSIIVPVRNEPVDLLVRLIKCVGRLDWPRDKYELIIVDDSDEPVFSKYMDVLPSVAKEVGVELKLLHRRPEERRGYVAGALNYGLKFASGDYIVVLNADSVPYPNMLRVMAAAFEKFGLDFIQCRVEYFYELKTRVAATSRSELTYVVLLNSLKRRKCLPPVIYGFAYAFRKSVLEAIGGWDETSITEDLEIGIRASAFGYRGSFIEDVVAKGEATHVYSAYVSQNMRWFYGQIDTLFRKLPKLIRRLSLPKAIDAVIACIPYTLLFTLMLTPLAGVLTLCQEPNITAQAIAFAAVIVSGALNSLKAARTVMDPETAKETPLTILVTASLAPYIAQVLIKFMLRRPMPWKVTPKGSAKLRGHGISTAPLKAFLIYSLAGTIAATYTMSIPIAILSLFGAVSAAYTLTRVIGEEPRQT